jgi:Histidine kinase-, DNA gyrase B-, and HSP90-like ATPase
MGETRVDLVHLLEDLRDAYPGATEETILTEIVANSLDSAATTVTIATDPARSTLTIVDNGLGMRRRELARYHDIAASAKVRGAGIGFAGVGIKIGLLVSEEVLTETRRGQLHIATTWHLGSRQRAPWRWVPAIGLVESRGTAVRLRLSSPLSPLLDPAFIEVSLRQQLQPLFDPGLLEILARQYPRGITFILNGRRLELEGQSATDVARVVLRLPQKRKPVAAGYLFRDLTPLHDDARGIAVSTHGKVIKRGWDWLGLTPSQPDCIGGLIEAPALAECLTLNKADFIRTGARGASYLAHRKAIQEAVRGQLMAWGDALPSAVPEHRRAARPVERDLHAILVDLADHFPMLASLVEQQADGQRRLPISAQIGGTGRSPKLIAAELAGPLASETNDSLPTGAGSPLGEECSAVASATLPVTGPRRGQHRPGRYQLSIQFEQRPGDPELGRLVGSTVWVNEAHPAYRRAAASRSEAYHLALAVALTLAPLAVEPAKEHAFVTAFLVSWGATLDRKRRLR